MRGPSTVLVGPDSDLGGGLSYVPGHKPRKSKIGLLTHSCKEIELKTFYLINKLMTQRNNSLLMKTHRPNYFLF